MSSVLNKMEPLPASYYGKIDKKNPVISAFDGEIKEFKSCIKRMKDSPKFDQSTYVRGSKLLFDIWNKYRPRLPANYYDHHVLQMADFLFSNKLYHLAQWQGYDRYLCEHGNVRVDNIRDIHHFKSLLFPEGCTNDQAKLTLRALQGQCVCLFHLERARGRDPGLHTVHKMLSLLGFLRTMMQALLPHEDLCWMVYNGSLYIYDICKYLMGASRHAQALEFLLWSCLCFEMCIPLASPRFLSWRSSLYCAASQCYYEGQNPLQGEVFARRALMKVTELAAQHDPLSVAEHAAFKEAAIKLATMVFKRSVYEPRRKPKSSFRPKTKNCLKEASNMPWPRNHSERILCELFDSNAAQFLAVLEGLWDSTRRPLQTGGPEEPELMDVALELMAAGVSLLSGVGGSTELQRNDSLPVCLNAISADVDLLEVAVEGGNLISVSAAVRFVKLLFRYEQWDMFKYLSSHLIAVLQAKEGASIRSAEAELSLLCSMDNLLTAQKTRQPHRDNSSDDPQDRERSLGSLGMSAETMEVIEVLHKAVCGTPESPGVSPDADLVLDVVLYLWGRCKLVFQKTPARFWESSRHMSRTDSQDKWVKALFLLNEVAEVCNLPLIDPWVKALFLLNEVAEVCDLALIDPVCVGEMTLRLALVLENSIDNALSNASDSVTPESSSVSSLTDKPSISLLKFPAEQQLQLLYDVLERGLAAVCDGNTKLLPCDGTHTCDMAYMQKYIGPGRVPEGAGAGVSGGPSYSGVGPSYSGAGPSYALSMDIQVELQASLHRAALKLAMHTSQTATLHRAALKLAMHTNHTECVIEERIKKNKVSRALYLMQKALLLHKTHTTCSQHLLEEAQGLLEKAEVEERRLFQTCGAGRKEQTGGGGGGAGGGGGGERGSKGPPPPILLARTNHSMTFTPAPYSLEEQVCWYQILGREADGINLKVRLGDCQILGTGIMVPSRGERVFRVDGLHQNQKYVFAVAAYDGQGRLVGHGIGDTGRPLLASAPLALLTAWAHLAQGAAPKNQKYVFGVWRRTPARGPAGGENGNRGPGETPTGLRTPAHGLPGMGTPGTGRHYIPGRGPGGIISLDRKLCSKYLASAPLALLPGDGHPGHGLCVELLQLTSPVLHQLFFSSIFMQTEIHAQEGALHCDVVCDQGPPIWGQQARLAECERLLVALDLALWLNDSGAALQVVVGCYGLLAPLIYHQINSDHMLQVLVKCLAVLQEVCGVVKRKRTPQTAESLQHMVACMTYYVVKGLRQQKETRMANTMIEQCKKLLTDIMDKTTQTDDTRRAAGVAVEEEMSDVIKSLDSMRVKRQERQDSIAPGRGGFYGATDLTGHEDLSVLYSIIETHNTRTAFRDVMRFKRKQGFLEFVVAVLQRVMQEQQPEQLTLWGQEVLYWLNRRDEELVLKKAHIAALFETRKLPSSPGVNKVSQRVVSSDYFPLPKCRNVPSLDLEDMQSVECKALDTLLLHLTQLMRRRLHRRRLRVLCSEEWVWRCHVNLLMADAFFLLLQRTLQTQGGTTEQSYSRLPGSLFSLEQCGTLVYWSSMQYSYPPEGGAPTATASPTHTPTPANKHTKAAKHKDRSQVFSSSEDSQGESELEVEQQESRHRLQRVTSTQQSPLSSPTRRSTDAQLDLLTKAATHLRRAMVLAHRGGHWSSLQRACGVLWDQVCVLSSYRPRSNTAPCCPALEQLHAHLTPLLTVACELLMDMMQKQELWQVYEGCDWESEHVNGLHFSSSLDDTTHTDLRWLRSLLMHTLTLLHHQERWETLTHLALTYNHYTRERYSHVISPLLVYSQRRLMERIAANGGPPAPQPHYTQTAHITGHTITNRNYVGSQVIRVWNVKTRINNSKASADIMDAPQTKRALGLVSVPLDVEDTLACFREALDRGSHTLLNVTHSHTLLMLLLLLNVTHSHTLLMLLLAHTQPSVEVPLYGGRADGVHSPGKVAFSGLELTAPSLAPPDLSAEDYSALSSVCAFPLPPTQTATVVASLTATARHLQSTELTSLRAQTLHDLGNLHLYKGNKKMAHSCWAKALDCALGGVRVLEVWDGLSWEGLSCQQLLRHAGIWGCLQGAVVTAKIAQYVLTSNISQRTRCCLLSAYIFKSLLHASLPHPEGSLQYSSYTIEGDLVPGLQLFGDAQRASVSSTVASLHFLCHWLYTAGHHLTLKLSFANNKPLTDPANIHCIEELVRVREAPELSEVYGPLLVQWLLLIRAQLLLGLSQTIHDLPEPLAEHTPPRGEVQEDCGRQSTSPRNATGVQTSKPSAAPRTSGATETPSGRLGEGRRGGSPIPPGRLKAWLLKEACSMLAPLLMSSQHAPPTDPEEAELLVEAGLLLSRAYLLQGRAAHSADQAVCLLRFLQESPLYQTTEDNNTSPATQDEEVCEVGVCVEHLDSPRAVEARERMGPSLWLRCRRAAIESLVAHLPQIAITPGVDSSVECECVLKEALQEVEGWGCVETKAALLLMGVRLDTHRAQPPEYSAGLLQECVSLLSGRTCVSLEGCVTLAKATLLLSDLRGSGAHALLRLTQTLLTQQLSVLGERVCVSEGGRVLLPSSPGLLNTHQPQLPLLATTTLRLGYCLLQESSMNAAALHAAGLQPCQSSATTTTTTAAHTTHPAAQPLKPGSALSNQSSCHSNQSGARSYRSGSLSGRSAAGTGSASARSHQSGYPSDARQCQAALDVLQSALVLSQALGSRQHHLEADILYCRGLAERNLLCHGKLSAHSVAKTFLWSINICMEHSPNTQHIQRCYVEMAAVYLRQYERKMADRGKNTYPSMPGAKASTGSSKAPSKPTPPSHTTHTSNPPHSTHTSHPTASTPEPLTTSASTVTEHAKSTPSEPQKSTQSEAQKSTPPERQNKSTPPERQKSTQSDPQKSTPPERQKSTQSVPQKSTQSETQKSTPPERQKSTQSDPHKSTQSDPQKSTPPELAKSTTSQSSINTSSTQSSSSAKAPASDSVQDPNRPLTTEETHLLFTWICLRAARETAVAGANRAQLSASLGSHGDDLPPVPHSQLPHFAISDLLKPCGGMDIMNSADLQVCVEDAGDLEASPGNLITWQHLAHYTSYLTSLLSLSCPVGEVYGGLMSLAEDPGVCVRLGQLHSFLHTHLPTYRDTCSPPRPPNHLLLNPQLLQSKDPLSSSEPYPCCPPSPRAKDALPSCEPYPWCPAPPSDPVLGPPIPELLPWATVARPELTMLWHHPTLEPDVNKGQILLYYGGQILLYYGGQILLYYCVNLLPISSSSSPSHAAVEGLRTGRRTISLHRLQVLHGQLSAVCLEVTEANADPTSTHPTHTKHQLLQERSRQCCAEIRRLLSPNAKPNSATEVPCEGSLQALCDLERCFDPAAQGATVADKTLISWLLPLLEGAH
ncbi:cilia- and flagella-associated protein 54 [Engraulis encrasicolus]|uniref:cilia- and flagella-associated protein 54 n=1 Tax=Engraulis encrasicolus TaxID=184585 RepID=UPI002FD386C6